MNRLLHDLSQLSGLKDRQSMDDALVEMIGEASFWSAQAVHLVRAVGPLDSQRWITLAQWDRKNSLPRHDAPGFDLSGLPRLSDFPHRESALLANSVVHTGQGPFTVLFPIDTQATVCSLLELQTEQRLSDAVQSMVQSLLQIYAHLQDLLDYGERDTLTELLNRKTFDRAFLRAAQTVADRPAPHQPDRRQPQHAGSYWLAIIDIDHFKQVNDQFGHLIGDEVLLLLSRLMRASFRFHDQLYRFGGEEFVVLMRCTDHDDAQRALERFRLQVGQHAFPQVGHITVSIGFAPLRGDDTPSGAFDRADKALYHAKSHGRNQTCSHARLVEAGELLEEADAQEVDFF